MKQSMLRGWKRTPDKVRRPIILVIGLFFILLSGSIGWLPGPGGIPIFLLGIAILASEFHWAHRLKTFMLDLIHTLADWIRENRLKGVAFLCLSAGLSIYITYMLFLLR